MLMPTHICLRDNFSQDFFLDEMIKTKNAGIDAGKGRKSDDHLP